MLYWCFETLPCSVPGCQSCVHPFTVICFVQVCVCVWVYVCVDADKQPNWAEEQTQRRTDIPTPSQSSSLWVNFQQAAAAVIATLYIQGAMQPCWPPFMISFYNQPQIRRVNEGAVKLNTSAIHSGDRLLLWRNKGVSAGSKRFNLIWWK